MRLPAVLADPDLSPVELQAARLDGEVYDLAGAFCLIGELETPTHRAHAVLGTRSVRFIADLGTAAWIWGAGREPEHHEFAVTPDARARLAPAAHATVREIVFEPGDVVDLGGHRVTSPIRTVVEFARRAGGYDARLTSELCTVADLGIRDALELLAARPGIPGKRLAERRLAALLGGTGDVRR